MVASDPPTNLSAESGDEVTIELRWSTPANDGGSAITGYQIERNLNGAGFVVLVTDTVSTLTAFADTTLSARDTAAYRVSAINGDGTSLPSNFASATTSTSEAQSIKELLFDNWSLTGELNKNVVNNMTEPVHFFNRGQVPGNKFAKAITVQKINTIGNENIIEHPTFFEQSDTFEVTCFLQVPDSADDVFSVWIDLMEQMTGEVTKILSSRFSPANGEGQFFRVNIGWNRDDTFFPDDPELTRTLRFSVTRIFSNNDEVFLGYNGVLAFQVLGSVGDNLPTSDYVYTQVYRVEVLQGWRNLPYITTDEPTSVAVPIYFRGSFSGRFSCLMDLKKSDIIGNTLNILSQIFQPQSEGELGTAVFLHNVTNTESPTETLSESIPVNITQIEKITENEQLVKFHIRGNLTGPSTFFLQEQQPLMGYEDGESMQYEDIQEMQYG